MMIRPSARRVTVAAGLLVATLFPASSAFAHSAAPAHSTPALAGATAVLAHDSTDSRRGDSKRATAAKVALPKGFRPEGITSGPGSRFYAGSVSTGTIYAGDLRTGKGAVLVPGIAGASLRGLFWDRRTNLVWAVGSEGTTGVVLAFDGRSGDLKSRTTVPGATFLNDLVVTRNAVWVTDSAVDRLTRIALGKGGWPTTAAPTFVALGGPWPTSGAFRANGIRALPDGSLLVNHTAAGGLWRVDPKHATVSKLVVEGAPAVTSGDGLELVGKTVYVVRGNGANAVSVLTLRSHHGTWSAKVTGLLTSPDLDVPSTATAALGGIWAVNARFGVANPTTADYWVTQLPGKPSHESTH